MLRQALGSTPSFGARTGRSAVGAQRKPTSAFAGFRFCPKAATRQVLRKRRDWRKRSSGACSWPSRIPIGRSQEPSEGPVDAHCPAGGVEDAGNEDSPLAMTEGGIKPERLRRQTDNETPPAAAAKQHCSDRTHEYGGLRGKLEPRPVGGRQSVPGDVGPRTSEQPRKLQGALPEIGTVALSTADRSGAAMFQV